MTLIPQFISEHTDRELLERVFIFSENALRGVTRLSGEPYFVHALETARILHTLGADSTTITAGLLHDTVDDGNVSLSQIEEEFGSDMRRLVEGTMELGKLHYHGSARHVETLQKFFLAIAQDLRILVVKLADRLHNMRTLQFVPEPKKSRIAKETLEVYAPLASRLGVGKIKGELEDLAFFHLDPKAFEMTKSLRAKATATGELALGHVLQKLTELAKQESITLIQSDYRVKHVYSLHKKLARYKGDEEKIFDTIAMRIIVPEITDCYRLLGLVHEHWKPVPGRIKDYIAIPKPNGYQSLHTTIFADNTIVEVQIRTALMHEAAEFGVMSAHTLYKANPNRKNLSWIEQLLDWQRRGAPTKELEDISMDILRDRIFVFTPKGEVVELPEDSTPIDFAFAIHSDIGSRATGSKVNGKMVALNTKLKSGDVVSIETRKSGTPSAKWLDFVKTAHAKKEIRAAQKTKR